MTSQPPMPEMTIGVAIASPTRMIKNWTISEIWSAIMPPRVVYRMMIIPAIIMQSFVFNPVSVATTEPDAATCDDVRQKRARTLSTAAKTELNFPNLLPTTSGIVTASVFLIFGAKYARGIIAMDAAKTYHIALSPQEPKAFSASPVVQPPPMLFAERENATIKIPILLPASM